MTRAAITIATWDYDRVRAVMDGRVRVEGCAVNYLALPPEECFHRGIFHGEFEVAEIGMSPYLVALSCGDDHPYIAIPVFLSRMFRHSAIYIRTDRGIAGPADLRGKRIGVPEYQMSAVLWARGMLQDQHGVQPADIRWFQGGLEIPGRREKFPMSLPAGFPLAQIAEGATLSRMLAEGELDAVITARTPSCYRAAGVPVARLFEDYASAEAEYYRRTGIFPIMHALGVRRDVHARHPWLASSLCKAFSEAKRLADAEFFETTALKIGLPWIGQEASRTRGIMGEDFWPYGVAANRRTLEAMARYSHEHGLSARRVSIEQMFAPATLESVKV
jgi:4,5-dihydroxyphthalate decarboxylase